MDGKDLAEADSGAVDPGTLRFLKVLVGTLTAVMILGLIAIVALLVIRLGPAPAPTLPDAITLPDGTTPLAVTYGAGWYAVATDEALLIYGTDGTLRQTVEINLE
ncbi:DUF6476 family protein [Pseudaestuariivita sp.]|uniref:DUF6476 family protein n=1 Tax=Pseudaestuariivita sp. TaxID=2211669 RepID=UPI00405904E4